MIINVLGIDIDVSDKIYYAESEASKDYIKAIKIGRGLAKKILKI